MEEFPLTQNEKKRKLYNYMQWMGKENNFHSGSDSLQWNYP